MTFGPRRCSGLHPELHKTAGAPVDPAGGCGTAVPGSLLTEITHITPVPKASTSPLLPTLRPCLSAGMLSYADYGWDTDSANERRIEPYRVSTASPRRAQQARRQYVASQASTGNGADPGQSGTPLRVAPESRDPCWADGGDPRARPRPGQRGPRRGHDAGVTDSRVETSARVSAAGSGPRASARCARMRPYAARASAGRGARARS